MTEIAEQLTKYLTDAHSIEEQALAQLRTAPDLAGDDELSENYREHLRETKAHEQRIRSLLDARGAKPSLAKDTVMKVGGKGFLLFARLNPDTPGKLHAHALSYEALELSSYELLRGTAERADETEVAKAADEIAAEELAGSERLASIYAEHLDQTRDHAEAVEARLQALGGDPSTLKDAALRLGALNWGAFFQAHPDTPGKLAAFARAFEHLEIGGYEQLRRVAERAGDEETAALVERILAQDREAADRIAGAVDEALTAALEAQEGSP